ncbi:MAG: Gfo/Idh/MocA family protein, partial [Gemmataceae bacterium]
TTRADAYRTIAPHPFVHRTGPQALAQLPLDVDAVIVATPDDRHFEAAQAALQAGKHVLLEKPSVLRLQELDILVNLAAARGVLAKVVYHKLFDPDHRRLRSLVLDGKLRHVNNGYCTLLEPLSISTDQFAEWVTGRNPATYVAVHYLKLIDFTFGGAWRLHSVRASGQRGIVRGATSPTWDSVQLQVSYEYTDGRTATFDIHTSWVNPDNFPGSVEQEVQFRFDNGVWNAHQRKRGVEVCISDAPEVKSTPNHHYNASLEQPWGGRQQQGYGLAAIERFFHEVAFVEYGTAGTRPQRLGQMQSLPHNDLAADRNCVAILQSLEAILAQEVLGRPGAVVQVNGPGGGLVLRWPGSAQSLVLYPDPV